MKKIIQLVATLTTTMLLLTSCSGSSLRPHDALSPINVVFMHVGWYGTSSYKYAKFTDDDLKRLTEIGVDEVCISYGTPITSYIPNGATEPVQIITEDDIYAITSEQIGSDVNFSIYQAQTALKQKLNGRDTDLLMNEFAEDGLELARRLVEVNPDIKLWYFFPDILIQTLAEKYIDPLLEYYDIMKNGTDPDVWENNVQGFYWSVEEISDEYAVFNTDNQKDFDNAHVKAMKACADVVHDDGKLTFWCPFYRSTSTIDTATQIGYVANRTDIFDYVILQPNHLFDDNIEYNLEILRNSTLQNAVLDCNGNVVGGKKNSSTMIGPEMEMEGALFTGKNSEEMIARYKDYVNAYKDLRGQYSFAYYCGERNSMMSEEVFNFLKEFLQDENPS